MAIISWANQSNKPLNSLSALDNHRKMRKSYDGSLVIWLQKISDRKIILFPGEFYRSSTLLVFQTPLRAWVMLDI